MQRQNLIPEPELKPSSQMSKLARVNRANKCLICSSDSWCMYNEDTALCMRLESSRPITLKGGDIGWWHDLKDKTIKPRYVKPAPAPPKIDAEKLWLEMDSETYDDRLSALAEDLGVTFRSLNDIGAVWCSRYSAWGFPMRGGDGLMVGIRLRKDDGSKFAYPGSRQGIFIPCCQPYREVALVEGPTDACALMSMGVYTWGRPSCSGGVLEVLEAIKRFKIERAVVVCDADTDREIAGRKYNPGYDGGLALSKALPIPHCVISLPCKDAREFLKMGGNRQTLESIVNSKVWTVSAASPETCPQVHSVRQ